VTTTGRGIAVTGPKLIYTPDGERCYAYSGIFSISGSSSADNTLLKISSKNNYIKARIQLSWADNTGANAYFEAKMNDVSIIKNKWDDAGSASFVVDPYILIIPPQTDLKILLGSASSGAVDVAVTLIGKVYSE